MHFREKCIYNFSKVAWLRTKDSPVSSQTYMCCPPLCNQFSKHGKQDEFDLPIIKVNLTVIDSSFSLKFLVWSFKNNYFSVLLSTLIHYQRFAAIKSVSLKKQKQKQVTRHILFVNLLHRE